MIKRLIIALLSIFIINFIYNVSNSRSQIQSQDKHKNILPLIEAEAFAETTLKINTVNFDNSDSIIFLGTTGFSTGATLSVNKGRLSNPDRVYYDLDNAIVNTPITTYNFRNSILKDLKISQFSRNPDKVRIAITYSSETDSEQIRLLKHGNNLIIKMKNDAPVQEYLTQVYRELKDSPFDFYAKTTIQPAVPPKVTSSNETFNQIQKAFNETSGQMSSNIGQVKTQSKPSPSEQKLKSRFYIDKMFLRQGNILLSGIGVVNLEKMIYLSNPSRAVFDMPNTIVAPELRNKEIKLNTIENVRLGQFEPTKARVVITTPTPWKYRTIYSFDLQGILIAHDDRMTGVKLFNTTSNLKYTEAKVQSQTTSNLLLDFSNPIVHSLKRGSSNVELKLYNATQSNMEDFRTKIKNTPFAMARIDYLPYQGLKIEIPVSKDTTVDCYESLNATQLKLTLRTPLPPPVEKPKPKVEYKNIEKKVTTPKRESSVNTNRHFDTTSKTTKKLYSTGGKLVILDPGHGGTDTGAMRAGIAEKDITLDIAKKTAAILKGRGLKVEMTRWNDSTVSLQDRVEQSNAKHTDIFVSIHINACVSPDAHGIETHYYTENGFEVAKVLHRNIMAKINATNRGLCKSKFYVINHTVAPSVLLELGFISNDNERNALLTEERKQKSAEAIANGVIEYLKTQPKR